MIPITMVSLIGHTVHIWFPCERLHMTSWQPKMTHRGRYWISTCLWKNFGRDFENVTVYTANYSFID